MYRLPDGTLRYSPKDLIAYFEGEFVAWCERRQMERSGVAGTVTGDGAAFAADERDAQFELVTRHGNEHEARYLAVRRAAEPGLVEIADTDVAVADTFEAMRAGAPIIYQGRLELGAWQGIPDFLIRVPGKSLFGDWHYEPWDTKLARSARPYFILQLCAYAEMLEAMQGVRPTYFCFVLGNSEERRFKTDDYYYYYLTQKASFCAFQRDWSREKMPDPGLERSFGRWSGVAERLLERSDHLSRVANITRGQIKRLGAAGITTLTALSTTIVARIPNVGQQVFERLRQQAALQIRSQGQERPVYEVRIPTVLEPRRGLAMLPPPRALDVFFDMEGFPFAEGGLEYLFGAVSLNGSAPEFRDWWAHDHAAERSAFEAFIDWAYARWKLDPAMHIYHYAPYERGALSRLMGKFATREEEVDDLLRHEVLVDLYAVVRQGLVVGTPGYSLKDIERLFAPPREGGVTNAGDSVVEYQYWMDSGEPPRWQESPLLNAIREYNRVDCENTWRLRDWLIERQRESGVVYVPPGFGGDMEGEITSREPTAAQVLASKLLAQALRESDPERRRVTELLGHLVEFHRREEKPMWWRYFERRDRCSEEDLYDDFDCLAGLQRTETPPHPVRRSTAYEYSFDNGQDTKLREGSQCAIAGTLDGKCKIETMDLEAGLLELVIAHGTLPDRLSLIPNDHVDATVIKTAVLRFATAWSEGQVLSQAADDMLFRRLPRVQGHTGGTLVREGEDLLAQVTDLVRRMDRTTLCIQGPPGTGKTYTAAAVIDALLRQGKRVGIAANSHKVILNVLAAIVKRQGEDPVGTLYKVGGESDDDLIASGRVEYVTDARRAGEIVVPGPAVFGGTKWFFSRPEMAGRFDYLFIDEAGQVGLADAIAMGISAANVVLIGDQMQLPQPMQGVHPPESGLSCLEYVLQEHATIPPELGVFLGITYRMHPSICEFISQAIYDGRLTNDPETARNRIVAAPGANESRETGVVFVPVEHEGCAQSSEEEAEVIAKLSHDLLTRDVEGKSGILRRMALADILFVAPFNMQVRDLRQRFGAAARVGSVDKFQGQEAPVVVISMCSSSLQESPRGAEFLLNPNRLNVAVSRAEALAIVVASPDLIHSRCGDVETMRYVNMLCRLATHSES